MSFIQKKFTRPPSNICICFCQHDSLFFVWLFSNYPKRWSEINCYASLKKTSSCFFNKCWNSFKMETEIKSCLKGIIFPLRALKIFGGLPLTLTFTEGHTEVKFCFFEGFKIFVLIFLMYCSWMSLPIYDVFRSISSNSVSLINWLK